MSDEVDIAKLIDYTLLRPDATEKDIIALCNEAGHYGFHSVCIHPSLIKAAKNSLSKTGVRISTVIGFPLGMTFTGIKLFEAVRSVSEGADELDIVINIGLAKSGKWKEAEKEISDIISATSSAVHKIIIETCYLSDREKKTAARACMNAGAEFIKTSTGFGPSGATAEDVRLIMDVTGGRTGIKASGGISSLAHMEEMLEAGATRIGTSSGVSIMKEIEKLDNSD